MREIRYGDRHPTEIADLCGKHLQAVSAEALDLLERYPWPGNVRELQSVLKQAILRAAGPVLPPEALPTALRELEKAESPSAPSGFPRLTEFIQERLQDGTTDLHAETLATVERQLFAHVLRHTGGNLSHAARILGINRATLRNRILALGISLPETGRG